MLEEDDNEDSLDLLLDTLCNAFGGIILITLLIALMSQEAHQASGNQKSFRTQALLEEQKIARLDDEIVIEKTMTATLPDSNESEFDEKVNSLIREKGNLESGKAKMNAENSRLQRRLARIPTNSTNLAEDLENRQVTLKSNSQRLGVRNQQLKQTVEDLRATVSKSNAAIIASKRERTERLRLPKEKGNTGKKYLWIVVKYGEIFPTTDNPSDMFEISKVITTRGAKGLLFAPKSGKGYDPRYEKTELTRYLRKVKRRSEYLSFMVYPNDSCFKAFNLAKNMATMMGIGYTWEPKKNNLVLSSVGQGARPEQ